MRKNRIILVANSSWNIFNFRLSLIKELYLKGREIFVLAPEDEYSPKLKEAEYLKFIPINKLQPKGLNPLSDFRLFVFLYKQYKKIQPDYVFHFTVKPNIYGGLAAQLAGVKYISVITGLGYVFIQNGWLAVLIRRMYALAFRKALAVVVQNADDKEMLLPIIPNNRDRLIRGSGVDIEYFQPTSLPQDFNFIFIGRLLKDKGIIEFLEAAMLILKTNQDCKFTVVGEQGANNPAALSEDELSRYKKHSQIQFVGKVDDVRPFIEQASVMVLPSYREGMPRAVLEAMSMARPIITVNSAGCKDTVIPAYNGWLVDMKTVIPLAVAMKEALNMSRMELEKMGANSRTLVGKHFAIKIINKGFLALLT